MELLEEESRFNMQYTNIDANSDTALMLCFSGLKGCFTGKLFHELI